MRQSVLTDIESAFGAMHASCGERGQALLESGLTYGRERPVLVVARKREARYLFTDDGAALGAAGRPAGWRDVADRVAGEYIVNISRRGDVFLPATSRQNTAWILSLPGRIAEASHALYAGLLELD